MTHWTDKLKDRYNKPGAFQYPQEGDIAQSLMGSPVFVKDAFWENCWKIRCSDGLVWNQDIFMNTFVFIRNALDNYFMTGMTDVGNGYKQFIEGNIHYYGPTLNELSTPVDGPTEEVLPVIHEKLTEDVLPVIGPERIWHSNYRTKDGELLSASIKANSKENACSKLEQVIPDARVMLAKTTWHPDLKFDPYIRWQDEFEGVTDYHEWHKRKFPNAKP